MTRTLEQANRINRIFPIVDVEGISLQDEFMRHKPKSNNQRSVYNSVVCAKEIGMPNFRAPAFAPSFLDDGQHITYEAGKEPALGKSAEFWERTFKEFMQEKNCQMGIEMQHDAYLATIIKFLIKEGYEIGRAWRAVCDDSKELGHYCNSENSKNFFEPTGSRPIGQWFDLGNASKIIRTNDGSGFIIAGGDYHNFSHHYPLGNRYTISVKSCDREHSFGWCTMDV